jgi:myo-inositol 2-dehydrogenase / D-chiro-inositol 1-dehydrogenase
VGAARKPGQSEMEYQMRNWYYFNWLCGDHIVEQHIHNLDVSNWLKNAYPVEATAWAGARCVGQAVRRDLRSPLRRVHLRRRLEDVQPVPAQPGTWSSVSEFAHGTNGHADISGAKIYKPNGELAWSYGRGGGGGHQEEHHDLFREIREGRVPNEGEYGAMSTMTAVLGRLATYSGKKVSMDEALEKNTQLADTDKLSSFKDEPPVQPDKDGGYESSVAVPGKFDPFA